MSDESGERIARAAKVLEPPLPAGEAERRHEVERRAGEDVRARRRG